MAYERTFPVRDEDIDGLGHVNNLVYVRWVGDVARAHWDAAARLEDRESTVWVVLRHEVDYLKPAVAGDRVVARTWVEEWKGVRSDRRTEIRRASDDEVLCRARTVWCALDARTHRPRRIPREMTLPFYQVESSG
ncbi:MAG: thioesterase family protein [Gemmatimonadota bacterium]|jgi:acyl-CoA thioester hydrolase